MYVRNGQKLGVRYISPSCSCLSSFGVDKAEDSLLGRTPLRQTWDPRKADRGKMQEEMSGFILSLLIL